MNSAKSASRSYKLLIGLIGIYILGSLIGLLLAIASLSRGNGVGWMLANVSSGSMIVYVAFLVGLLKRQKWMYKAGLIFFLVQIPVISTGIIKFSFYLGLKLFVTANLQLQSGAGAEIGVNVPALLAFLFLGQSYRSFWGQAASSSASPH